MRQVERVPEKFLKHISSTKGLYEIRIDYGSNNFRVFCFLGQRNSLVLLNAFEKKSRKIPKKEIELADKLKQEYFKEKGTNNGKP